MPGHLYTAAYRENQNISCLQLEVVYWPALAVGSAAQLAAGNYGLNSDGDTDRTEDVGSSSWKPLCSSQGHTRDELWNERTLDPAVCS